MTRARDWFENENEDPRSEHQGLQGPGSGGILGGTRNESDGNVDVRRPPSGVQMGPAGNTTDRRQADDPTGDGGRLLSSEDSGAYRARWESIQAGFVDRPRESVEAADSLVAEVMKRVAEGFASARSDLEGQWDRGDEGSTEELRVALQRYRSFFERLLAA
jgi:hypothetical protein